jgi:uncharacterized oligopeptide transporter (OPT) family protein
MAVLKMAKDSNILENNMVQTQASAAGTLSAIIPGMLMIGYWQAFYCRADKPARQFFCKKNNPC